MPRGDARARVTREAADVHLVDHGLGERAARAAYRPPSRTPAGSATTLLHRDGGVVAWPAPPPRVVAAGDGDRETVRIEQQLVGDRTAARAPARTGRAPGSRRSDRAEARHERMPVVIAAMLRRDRGRSPATATRRSAPSNSTSSTSAASFENTREVDAAGHDRGAERRARPRRRTSPVPDPAGRSTTRLKARVPGGPRRSRCHDSSRGSTDPTRSVRLARSSGSTSRVQRRRSPNAALTRSGSRRRPGSRPAACSRRGRAASRRAAGSSSRSPSENAPSAIRSSVSRSSAFDS
mgnify:CR=1 FL=1